MKRTQNYMLAFAAVSLVMAATGFAGEDVGNVAKNAGGEATNTFTQLGRWGARQGRKVTGSDTAAKDQADRDANAQENTKLEQAKLKRRQQEDQN